MADRVVLFENVAGLGRGYLQGIASDDVLLSGGFRRGTSSILIDGSASIVAAGANVTISAASAMALLTGADMTLSSGDDLILTAVDSILLTGSPITALTYFTTTSTVSQAALRVGSIAGDPSTLNDGDVWYNSTTARFRKREGGISSNFVSSNSATFVVHPSPGVGDFTSIALALAALPAEGGLIIVRESTYPTTTTITMPDKPVVIMGCGDGTTIDIGANAIAAFTIGFDRRYVFTGFKVLGSGIVSQKAFEFTSASSALETVVYTSVLVENIEKTFLNSGGGFPMVASSDCAFRVANLATSFHWDGAGEWRAENTICNFTGGTPRGGFANDPDLAWVNSEVWLVNGGATNYVQMSRCRVLNGILTIAAPGSVITGTVLDSSASLARYIDLPVTADSTSVIGCSFGTATAEQVRVASTDCVIEGNSGCEVTETGTATRNKFVGNSGFSSSTIIGPDSTIEGARRFDITGVTTAVFVTLFTHINPKGLTGIGTIKNTDGIDSLDVRETVIDSFGNTVSTVTTVVAGDTYMLDPQTDFSTTCFPPYVSYKVEVMDTAAGNPATFELHQLSQGAI